MLEAGIDLSKFKAHSTRSAAVSSVPLAGLFVDEIAKMGDWSNAGTFYKYSKRLILSHMNALFRSRSYVYLSRSFLTKCSQF